MAVIFRPRHSVATRVTRVTRVTCVVSRESNSEYLYESNGQLVLCVTDERDLFSTAQLEKVCNRGGMRVH